MPNPRHQLLANDLRCRRYMAAGTAMMAVSLTMTTAMSDGRRHRRASDEHRDADKDMDEKISMMLIVNSTTIAG